MRTSSIRPLKYSPQIALPPIFSAPVALMIEPLAKLVATCVPFTYRASTVPSYVAARCVHVPTGNCAVPRRSWSALV